MLNRKNWNLMKFDCKMNKCTLKECISIAQRFDGES